MEDILIDISAFRFHRVPPQVLMLLPMLPGHELDRNRCQLVQHPLVSEAISCPVHLLCDTRGRSHTGPRVVNHVRATELPPCATMDTGLGAEVATPLFALLTMASSVSEYRLAMMMYELCGTFAVFRPTPSIEALLDRAYAERLLEPSFGWRRMVGADGRKTSLWERSPLIEVGELQAYAGIVAGMKGAKGFAAAAASITGVTASPFEAQASMIMGMSRRRGGWGFALGNNIEMALTRSARLISGTGRRVADIVVTGPDGDRSVILECQGQAFHGSAEARIMDSDRATALQSMGHQVIQVSHAQIRDRKKCAVLVELIERMLGMKHREKTKLQQERELQMRREIFIPWESM